MYFFVSSQLMLGFFGTHCLIFLNFPNVLLCHKDKEEELLYLNIISTI